VLRASGKVKPIGGEGNPCGLPTPTAAWRIRPVIVEPYLTLGVVDMHIRRGHMAGEKGLPERQDAVLVARPGFLQRVAIGSLYREEQARAPSCNSEE
jgi:hypothetical protein